MRMTATRRTLASGAGRAAGQFDQAGEQKGGVRAFLAFPEQHLALGKGPQASVSGQGQALLRTQHGEKSIAESRQNGLLCRFFQG